MKSRNRVLLTSVVAASLAAGARAEPSLASFPGSNGRLAFEIDRDVFSMAPDGSGIRQLTSDATEEGRPAWSPDGATLAFEANRSFPDYDVFLMNADGSDQRALTGPGGADGQPAFSPDGRRLVFVSDRAGQYDLWTMAVDGTDVQRLTNDPGVEVEPAWSPDGRYITFDVDRDLFIIQADGTGRRLLTGTIWEEGRSSWAPDSSRLAFETNRDDANYEIYTIRPDGTDLQRITSNAAGDGQPAFSPDGREIAFLSNRGGQYDLWIMNANGNSAVPITDSPAVEREPDWQPVSDQSGSSSPASTRRWTTTRSIRRRQDSPFRSSIASRTVSASPAPTPRTSSA